MNRSRGRARIDVTVQRMIAWPAATAYSFVSAITSRDFFYLFVEMWDEVAAWTAKWT